MALFACNCINIKLECNTIIEDVEVGKFDLSAAEQRELFFHDAPSKLVMCYEKDIKSTISQPALLGLSVIGNWILHSCLACGLNTHAILQDKTAKVLINKDILTTTEKVEISKKSTNFSQVFNLLLPEVTASSEMKENIDLNSVMVSGKKYSPPALHAIGSLNKQLSQSLQSQLEAIEEKVRQFRDQKYAEFEAYRERAQRDHKILASIISKVKNNIESSVNIEAGVVSHAFSPQLTPQHRRRLSSHKDVKKLKQDVKSTNSTNDEDYLDTDDIFDIEGTDSRNEIISDQDSYDSDKSENDDDGVPMFRGLTTTDSDFARSLPVNMPNLPHERRDTRDLEDKEDPQDIAASIKALARSVHGDVFGELPRPRFSTQI